MARSLWDVFLSIIDRNTEDGDEEEDGFVPSPLDLSVRYSHGGPDDEIEREFQRITEQVLELEEGQRDE